MTSGAHMLPVRSFLSSNAQDFIEEDRDRYRTHPHMRFLSSNAQDFIEDARSET